jgi:MoaA/NifB/PqqE/SkfB family radical SAM enzyme
MCPHAINAVDRPKHLEPELVAGLETYLRQSHTIQLHGIGEPLASPAFWESLKFLPTDCESSINTNLVVLDDGRLQALLDSNLRAINVSLDAARPATYQKIRGHSFDAVIANMHRLIAARKVRARFPQLQMNMTLMRSNIEEVLEFIDLAADLGADKIWLWHLNKWSESEMKRYIVERDGWVFDYEKEGLWNFPELSNQYLRKAEARARERGVLLAMDHNKTVYFDESGVSHV